MTKAKMQVLLSAAEMGGDTVQWPTDANDYALPEAIFTDPQGRQLKYSFAAWTNPPQGVFADYAS